jgi:hypothetical protein
MSERKLEAALEIAAALGRRRDPYVGNIIEHFRKHHQGRRTYISERIIITLLSSLFPVGLSDAYFQTRFESNREALLKLIGGIDGYAGPDLRSYCLLLAGRSREAGFSRLLSRSGERIVRRLKQTGGLLTVSETEELSVFLTALERMSLNELKPLAADVARLTADKGIVERARKLLRR